MYYTILVQTFYIFFTAMETLLFLFIISSWLPLGQKLNQLFRVLMDPLLDPIRFMLKRSIFQSRIDLSPFVAMVLITYFEDIFYQLKVGL